MLMIIFSVSVSLCLRAELKYSHYIATSNEIYLSLKHIDKSRGTTRHSEPLHFIFYGQLFTHCDATMLVLLALGLADGMNHCENGQNTNICI